MLLKTCIISIIFICIVTNCIKILKLKKGIISSLYDAILKSLDVVVLLLSFLSEELVSIEELKDAIKRIQKIPDDSLVNRISEVLAKIDIDKDGAIRLDDVLKVSIPSEFQKST